MSRNIRLTAVAALLGLALAGTAHALPRGGRPAVSPDAVIGLFRSWLAGLPGLEAFFGKAGGIMDPNGQPTTVPGAQGTAGSIEIGGR